MTLPFSGFQLFRLFLPVCLALLVKFITVYFTRSFITNGMIFRIIACSSGAAPCDLANPTPKDETDETPQEFAARKQKVNDLLNKYGPARVSSRSYQTATADEKQKAREYLVCLRWAGAVRYYAGVSAQRRRAFRFKGWRQFLAG
jgi:hypothetical protein